VRILLFGGSGQLGRDIVDVLSSEHEVICPDHAAAPVEDEVRLAKYARQVRPEIIVNAAAYHDVENCEADPLTAFAVNALGPLYLSRAADQVGAALYHFSTDYVFSGRQGRPYEETDEPGPCNIYGHSKLAGERLALATRAGGYVLRVGALYGGHPCRGKGGRNFIITMIDLCAKRPEIAVVDHEIITPTCTKDVARQLSLLISAHAKPGLYHATCQGFCSWYDFAREIFQLLSLPTPLRRARPGEFPVKTPRPAMSVLSNAALKRASLDIMPQWEDALRNFIAANGAAISRWRAQAIPPVRL
jgi:dTDP-4-dehydrorhamnose reductase